MGRPKGLLVAPDGATDLVQRLVGEAHAALPGADCVLVGQRAEYDHLGMVVLPDAEPQRGPLGGFVALLTEADQRGHDAAFALACDMPYLSRTAITALARFEPRAAAVVPRRNGRWEPLAARYAPKACLPLAAVRLRSGQLSLQGLLNALGNDCREIALPAAELEDWDSPEDVPAP
jgi:molybdopterin-guanine dinucleotide biosynthesis protein A